VHFFLERADGRWRQLDVGIQQQGLWRSYLSPALFECPKLAAPARRKRRGLDDAQICNRRLARFGDGIIL
jgi:hypothetical protein